MNIKLDFNKIITTLLLAMMTYIGHTVYELDKKSALLSYQLEQLNVVLQDLYETKMDKPNAVHRPPRFYLKSVVPSK